MESQNIDARINAAEAKQALLQTAAEDAEAEAARAAKAYETHREANLLIESQVLRDKASDALIEAGRHQREVVGPLLRERENEENTRRAAEADTARAATLANFDEAIEMLVAAVQRFDAAISVLGGYHKTQMRGGTPLSLSRICNTLQARLDALRTTGAYADRSAHNATIRFENIAGSNHHVRITFVRPASSVPSSLW